MHPEIVADYTNHVGEGPTWNPREQKLYWIDIPNGRIFWYDPDTGQHAQMYEGPVMGGFTMQEDGSLLLFMENGAVGILRNGKLESVINNLPGENLNRFNDVIADPAGRVFGGTMPKDSDTAMAGEKNGTLYRIDTDGTATAVMEDLGIPNGLGFTPDGNKMYFTDSTAFKIYVFDYDQESGELSNRKVFIETSPDQGVPDGMTVDSEGFVWSARAMGGAIYRYTPEGQHDTCIRFDTANIPSSVAFGGKHLDELYVTTIGGENRSTNEDPGPDAGVLFRLSPGIKGLPENFTKVGL